MEGDPLQAANLFTKCFPSAIVKPPCILNMTHGNGEQRITTAFTHARLQPGLGQCLLHYITGRISARPHRGAPPGMAPVPDPLPVGTLPAHRVLPERNDGPVILDDVVVVLAIWGQGLGRTRHWRTPEVGDKPLWAGW